MTPATPTEITTILGDVGALVIERLLELHVTVDDLVEALACVEADRAGEPRIAMTTRVAEIYAILDEALEDEEDYAYPAVG